jgi:hypothetical protein
MLNRYHNTGACRSPGGDLDYIAEMPAGFAGRSSEQPPCGMAIREAGRLLCGPVGCGR